MGGPGFRQAPQTFEECFSCFSMAVSGRDTSLEEGDKILLPPSALHTLAGMNVDYPMLFQLTNLALQRSTHCGVLEFSAEEGRCYIPFWMMQNLMLNEGALITVKNVTLPKANFVKFRAQSCDFLEISNPRAGK
jgi:ubiquitin fusion degradation protein 1